MVNYLSSPQFIGTINSSSKLSDTHLWPPQVPGIHVVYIHPGRQNTYIIKPVIIEVLDRTLPVMGSYQNIFRCPQLHVNGLALSP